jgi:hypothetical protein
MICTLEALDVTLYSRPEGQRLGERPHHRAQQIRARLRELLLQPARDVNTGPCGHRVTPSHRDLWTELK